MAETERTYASLITLLGDGAAAHSTNRELIRDLLKSVHLYPTLVGETGVVSERYAYGDVRRFGAVGDGVTDNATAFAAATTWAIAANDTLTIPEPAVSYVMETSWVITAPLRVVGVGNHPRIRGSGLGAGEYVIDVGVADGNGIESVTIENISLEQADAAPWASSLMRLRNVANSRFSNIRIKEGKYGLHITGTRSFSNTYERIVCDGSGASIISDAAVRFEQSQHNHTFIGGSLTSLLYGVQCTGTGSMSTLNFYGTNFEGCGEASFFCEIHDIVGIGFYGTRSEGVIGDWDFVFLPPAGGYANGIVFAGAFFSGADPTADPDAEHAIVFSGSGGGTVTGASVTGCVAENYTVSFVRAESDGGEGSIVVGNTLRNCPAVINTVQAGMLVFNNIDQAGNFTGNQKWNPPLTTAALNAAAIDPASTMALVNQVRAVLIANGWTT